VQVLLCPVTSTMKVAVFCEYHLPSCWVSVGQLATVANSFQAQLSQQAGREWWALPLGMLRLMPAGKAGSRKAASVAVGACLSPSSSHKIVCEPRPTVAACVQRRSGSGFTRRLATAIPQERWPVLQVVHATSDKGSASA